MTTLARTASTSTKTTTTTVEPTRTTYYGIDYPELAPEYDDPEPMLVEPYVEPKIYEAPEATQIVVRTVDPVYEEPVYDPPLKTDYYDSVYQPPTFAEETYQEPAIYEAPDAPQTVYEPAPSYTPSLVPTGGGTTSGGGTAPAPVQDPYSATPKACPLDILGASACPIDIKPLTSTTGSGTTSAGAGGFFASTPTLARPVLATSDGSGSLQPSDSYSQGIIQGLQRTIGAFALSQGVELEILADGTLSPETVLAVQDILRVIGLPPGVDAFPQTGEDILRDLRRYAVHIANAAGVDTDFSPSAPVLLVSEGDPSRAPAGATQPGVLFSKRNISIGGVLLAAFLIFNRN